MGTHILGKIHNFGIYRKGGKRCILQLDFPGRILLIIQKGHIKKTFNFHALEHYDSEEGLHISLKLRDSVVDFEADNIEEKYTICRLLGFIVQLGHGEDDESIDSGQGLSSFGDHSIEGADVIKDGLLEKKGHTAITIWNKRRVKLTPGEFSYYKPGEELALNIVQLWPEHTSLKKNGQNGFSVTIRDKVYSFRVPSEYKALQMTEIIRNEWFVAFDRALNYAPPSAKIFGSPHNNASDGSSDDPEHIYDLTPDMTASAQNILQVPSSSNKYPQGEITAHVTVHLNYVDKALPTPPKSHRSKHHSLENLLFSHKKELKDADQSQLSSSDHSDLSAHSSLTDDHSDDDSIIFGSAAELRAKLAMQGGKSSALKAYRAQKDFKNQHGQRSTQTTTKLKAYNSKSLGIDQTNDSALSTSPEPSNDNLSNKHSSQSTLVKNFTDEARRKISSIPPPPPPPTTQVGLTSPPPPPGGPPPPPPLIKQHGSVKLRQVPNVKLKQVHWVKVNSSQISGSMWHDAHDMTEKLDLSELEDQFSIPEKKNIVVTKPKPQEEKQMLVDAKRAQNLGILFCGLKLDSLTKLNDALNSVSEQDSFPADKMATLKRYQPNAEEKEMYKLYAEKHETLHAADRFMLELCEIPQLSTRLDLILILWEFPDQYKYLEEEVDDLLMGSDEILSNTDLTTALEYLLAIGNYMNSLWNSQHGIQGFQLSSLDKVLSIKGKDNKTTICTYLVKQLKRNNPSLIDWPKHMSHVTKCAGYSVKAVGAEIDVLKNDLVKIKKIIKTLRNHLHADSKKFLSDVQNFIADYDRKLEHLEVKYLKVTEKYKLILAKFGEPPKSQDSVFSCINLFKEKFQHGVESIPSD